MLSGKNVVITGAKRGIGQATLQLLVKNHANCWCIMRSADEKTQHELDALSNEYGVWIRVVQADLSDPESISAACKAIQADRQRVDILINDAGVNHRDTFLMTSQEDMQRIWQVNYFAPLQLMKWASKKMIQQRGGVIVNVGSVSGFEHNTGNFTYAATKSALMWATQTLSRELSAYGIRVNGIAPGLTGTAINAGNEESIEREVLPRMNIKRYGAPEEIAEGILFLADEHRSSFVSGQILRIDGGRF